MEYRVTMKGLTIIPKSLIGSGISLLRYSDLFMSIKDEFNMGLIHTGASNIEFKKRQSKSPQFSMAVGFLIWKNFRKSESIVISQKFDQNRITLEIMDFDNQGAVFQIMQYCVKKQKKVEIDLLMIHNFMMI